ncbi:hypothetical protein [Streptomyces decoyicus]|nr:hypothetical protein [Streptomyces decoyicus]QZY16966.1 hypothetical protein K7C20_18330 [Streptomyces decoyicus]
MFHVEHVGLQFIAGLRFVTGLRFITGLQFIAGYCVVLWLGPPCRSPARA